MSFLENLQAEIQRASDRGEGASRAERVVMRICVLSCATLLIVGILSFGTRSTSAPSPRLNHLLDAIRSGAAGLWLPLGLLVLCLSPLLRAITLAALYARRRSWDLLLTTLIVVVTIVASFLIGVR